jgi:hypothetical protein
MMVEARNSVQQTNIRTRLHFATITTARQRAMKAAKRQFNAGPLRASLENVQNF